MKIFTKIAIIINFYSFINTQIKMMVVILKFFQKIKVFRIVRSCIKKLWQKAYYTFLIYLTYINNLII